tara:strand:+ start:196 stop:783 length:588 start_codon:yes stop_codon:yes gene_type:complete
MNSITPLANVHLKGKFGDYEEKKDEDLLKISELSNLSIIQVVQYKISKIPFENIDIDNLRLKNEPLNVVSNEDTRILWNGPKNWFVISSKKNLKDDLKSKLEETDFAVTDLSHSRAVIEIQGEKTKEVLKKGCPFDFNILEKNKSINSIFNGIAFTVDMMDNKPVKVRIFVLRSFGESLYHSITDASLEYGFKSI